MPHTEDLITRTVEQLSDAVWQKWVSLSPFDPTHTEPTHEKALLEWGLCQGAVLLILERAGQALARCAWKTVGSRAGDCGLGFIASRPKLADEDKVMNRLLEAVTADCRTSGGNRMIAPINLNSWFAYRLRNDNDPLSFAWEPSRQPALEDALKRQGFSPDVRYHSIGSIDAGRFRAYVEQAYRSEKIKGFKLELVEAQALSPAAIQGLYILSNREFAINPYFEPIDFPTFARLYLGSPGGRNQARISLAWSPEGQVAGFIYTFYEASVDAIVLKTGVVGREYQGLGLSNALIWLHLASYPTPPRQYISALMKAGQRSESYARHGQTAWHHEYLLYARAL